MSDGSSPPPAPNPKPPPSGGFLVDMMEGREALLSSLTNFAKNKLIDAILRGQSVTFPTTVFVALLTSTKGMRFDSTSYLLGDTVPVLANDGAVHLYKCTTAGVSASAQGALYPGVVGESITDGLAVFLEQTPALNAADWAEVSGAGYVRVKSCAGASQSLSDWKSTQDDDLASSGTSGLSRNTNAIRFPSPVGYWGNVWGVALFDALTDGNPWVWGAMASTKTIIPDDAAPVLMPRAMSFVML